jgi:hypothetical protein
VVAELTEAGAAALPPPAEHARPGLAEVRRHLAELQEHWGSWRSDGQPSAAARARVVADVLGDVLGFIDGDIS